MWGYTPVVSALQNGRREDQKFKDILKDIIHFTQPRLQEMLGGREKEGRQKERTKRERKTKAGLGDKREGRREGRSYEI